MNRIKRLGHQAYVWVSIAPVHAMAYAGPGMGTGVAAAGLNLLGRGLKAGYAALPHPRARGKAGRSRSES